MNSLIYTDLEAKQISAGNTLASTVQQIALSVSVATVSLISGLFLTTEYHPGASVVSALQKTFLLFGIFTMLTAYVYFRLKTGDGENLRKRSKK